MSDLEIVILDSDQRTVDRLTKACNPLVVVTFLRIEKVLYTHPPQGLDALFLVLPAAEQWGARPLAGQAQILKIPAEDQRDGMPRYVVTGVVLHPEDPKGALPETTLMIKTAVDAVKQFNSDSSDKIRKLGFWAVNLLKGLTPEQLAEILADTLLK